MRLLLLLLMAAPCAAEEIPLSEVISTSRQTGLQPVAEALSQIDGATDLEPFRRYRNGASNLFFVEAKKLDEALLASRDLILGSRGAGVPVRHRKASGEFWIVAYLGAGPSNPCWWVIDACVIENQTLRISYHSAAPSAGTKDLHQYWYWASLGKLQPGAYILELYDTKEECETLTRRVIVH
ncbi:hypothetical protein [Botrimarina mediterranea]|nr:hypothetical protein [Botrimarina mediterranea]